MPTIRSVVGAVSPPAGGKYCRPNNHPATPGMGQRSALAGSLLENYYNSSPHTDPDTIPQRNRPYHRAHIHWPRNCLLAHIHSTCPSHRYHNSWHHRALSHLPMDNVFLPSLHGPHTLTPLLSAVACLPTWRKPSHHSRSHAPLDTRLPANTRLHRSTCCSYSHSD